MHRGAAGTTGCPIISLKSGKKCWECDIKFRCGKMRGGCSQLPGGAVEKEPSCLCEFLIVVNFCYMMYNVNLFPVFITLKNLHYLKKKKFCLGSLEKPHIDDKFCCKAISLGQLEKTNNIFYAVY